MEKPNSKEIITRLLPPIAVWALTQLLETPPVRSALQEVDSRAHVKQRKAIRSVRRAGRNIASNGAWLVAGALAIAVGLGLIAKAARHPRK